MNTAFVLVTTAWLAGADAQTPEAKPAPPPPPAPVAASGCCDSGCDSCGGHRLFGKLRGMFRRNDCCDSCDSGGHGHRWAQRDCCDSCDDGCGFCDRLKARLRGLFHRDCCETSCCDGGYPAKAEPIPAPKSSEPPKKMPEPAKKSVRIITPEQPPPLAPANRLLLEQ